MTSFQALGLQDLAILAQVDMLQARMLRHGLERHGFQAECSVYQAVLAEMLESPLYRAHSELDQALLAGVYAQRFGQSARGLELTQLRLQAAEDEHGRALARLIG